MRTEKIELQKEYKYKELCELLGEEEKSRGNSRNSQFENWRRYFNFYKPNPRGQKFIVTDIYSEPKEKIDNRGKSEGSRNNNSVYMEHIDPILTDYFINMDNNVTYATINQLAETAGIINSNYKEFKDNQQAFFNYLKENKIIENSTAINNVFYSIQDILRPMISSSLDRLKNQGIIEYEYNYIFHKELEVRLATDEEIGIIKKCEDIILKELGIQKVDIVSNDTLRKEYYKKVNNLVYEEIKDIKLYYMSYKIIVNTQSELELENIQQHKEKLNSIVKKRVRDRNVRRKKETEDKVGFGSQGFKDYEEDTLKESYLVDTDIIIDYLLYPNIQKVDITKKKSANKETVENSLSVEKVISNEVDITDNITETKVEIYSPDSKIELAFDVSYQYDSGTGKLKDEYKLKPWKFEPKYQWQREDFIGYEDGEEEEIPF